MTESACFCICIIIMDITKLWLRVVRNSIAISFLLGFSLNSWFSFRVFSCDMSKPLKQWEFIILSLSPLLKLHRGKTKYRGLQNRFRYEVYTKSFQTFFVWALLLIVYTWNSSPLWSNLLRLQCTCCTVPTTSGRLHESPLVWACQWSLSQPLLSPQLSHNDSLWARE